MRNLVESYGGKIVDEVYVPMAASEQAYGLADRFAVLKRGEVSACRFRRA